MPPPEPDAPPVKHGTSMFPEISTPQFGGLVGMAVMLPVACPVTLTVLLAVKEVHTSGIDMLPPIVTPQFGGLVDMAVIFPCRG